MLTIEASIPQTCNRQPSHPSQETTIAISTENNINGNYITFRQHRMMINSEIRRIHVVSVSTDAKRNKTWNVNFLFESFSKE